MSGVGPLGGPVGPNPLRSIDKDGKGGGGGRYTPNRRDGGEHETSHDEADISAEARARSESGRFVPSTPAKLEILSDITEFNELHLRHHSKLRAVLKVAPDGSMLVIEDTERGVSMKPFGDRDIFQFTPADVRARLGSFDHSQGSIFDSTA